MQQQFLDAFWLPLLGLTGSLPDAGTRLQAATSLAQLLASAGHWEQLQQLMTACFASLDAAVPGCRSAAAAAAAGLAAPPGSSAATQGGAAPNGAAAPAALPLPVACALLVCCTQQLQPQYPAAQGAGLGANHPPRQLLQGLLAGLRSALATALLRGPQPARQAALRALLPAAIAVSRAAGPDATRSTAQELWRLALTLLGGDGAAQDGPVAAQRPSDLTAPSLADAPAPAALVASPATRAGLSLLVGAVELLADPEASGVDAAASERFWELLRGCLVGCAAAAVANYPGNRPLTAKVTTSGPPHGLVLHRSHEWESPAGQKRHRPGVGACT